MWDEFLFRCALCERDIRDYPHRPINRRQIEPICNYCMHVWGREPSHGAFMDRRIAARIGAVADKLATEAYCKQNSLNWGTHGTA